MFFAPSSSDVSDTLAVLKAEKAVSKSHFYSAVATESIKWEAELLLALEEFRAAGGFVGIQDHLTSLILAEQRAEWPVDKAVALDVPCHWSLLHDRMDVKTWLQTVSDRTVVVRSGEPTMATERAALRIRILLAVKKTIREAILAELEALALTKGR
jgi:hypothetical protein